MEQSTVPQYSLQSSLPEITTDSEGNSVNFDVVQHSDSLIHQDSTMTASETTSSSPSRPMKFHSIDVPNFHHPEDHLQSTQTEDILDIVELPNAIKPPVDRFFLELFSGPKAHLTQVVQSNRGVALQPVDLLQNPSLDILQDDVYEFLLKLVVNRIIDILSAAPPCTEYSILKLIPPGPQPCRTPDNMDSPLYDTPQCHHRFHSSREILRRTIHLLYLNHVHGGYSIFEQPSSAMSWKEPCVEQAVSEFLSEVAICAQCNFVEIEQKLNKEWKFASNIPNFGNATLICSCQTKHPSFAGVRNSSGTFQSASTAEYPLALAEHLYRFFPSHRNTTLHQGRLCPATILSQLPRGTPLRTINHIPDGGGLCSHAMYPLPFQEDVFKVLRDNLHQVIFKHRLFDSIPRHILGGSKDFPFSTSVMTEVKQVFAEFLQRSGYTINFDIPQDQPFRLFALQQLLWMTQDPDVQLIPDLIEGVNLGLDGHITPSNTWPSKCTSNQDSHTLHHEFLQFDSNWTSAEKNDELLGQLIQEEINEGFVAEFDSPAMAEKMYGHNLAIGKLAVVFNQSKKPRLVLDSSISGLNTMSAGAISEHCTYPTINHLRACIGTSTSSSSVLFNVDVKAAHKRIKVRPNQQGLLAFRHKDRLFRYKVLHFGGTCSAYYWSRLSAMILRITHRLLYLSHSALVFVDDFIFAFRSSTARLQACSVLLLFAFLNIPISWDKLALGHKLTWIGWQLNSQDLTVSLPSDKLQRFAELLYKISSPGKYQRKDVEKITGNLLWASEILHSFRFVLGTFYAILAKPGLQLVHLPKESIQHLLQHCTEHGHLQQLLPSPYIPQGSLLLRIGKCHRDKYDSFQKFKEACFDLNHGWVTLLNTRSNRVQINQHEADLFTHIREWFLSSPPVVPLCTHRRFRIFGGADAFASKTSFGLGLWLDFPSTSLWWEKQGTFEDLPQSFRSENLQSMIMPLEALAQTLIFYLFQQTGLRGIDFEIVTYLDNQAAEALLHDKFTQHAVNASVVRHFQLMSDRTRAVLTPHRVASAENTRADDLSRGVVSQEDPACRADLPFTNIVQHLQ